MAAFLRLNCIWKPLLKSRYHPPTGFRVLHSFKGTINPHQGIGAHVAKESRFSQIVQAVTFDEDPRLKDTLHHWKVMLEYGWNDLEKHRVTTLVYQSLNEHRMITKQQLNLVQTMEMIIEVLKVGIISCDDIMDNSPNRYGKPTWYDKKGIAIALNDTMVNLGIVYKLLKMHFRDEPFYINVVELLHEAMLKGYLGESFQASCEGGKKSINFEKFTLSNYATIAEYRTTYPIFVFPIATALYMSEISDTKTHAYVRELTSVLGLYWQVTNDYLDCFGDPVKTGILDLGRDIQEGKFTWLVANALKMVDQRQHQVLKANYGNEEPQRVQRIVDLYRDLGIPKVFANYEKDVYKRVDQIRKTSSTSLSNSILDIFLTILNAIRSRAHQ